MNQPLKCGRWEGQPKLRLKKWRRRNNRYEVDLLVNICGLFGWQINQKPNRTKQKKTKTIKLEQLGMEISIYFVKVIWIR